MPSYVHADIKDYRACISKAATERKTMLKKVKDSRKTFLLGVEKDTAASLEKEAKQYESDLSFLKKKRNDDIQNTLLIRERKNELEKIKNDYFNSFDKLKLQKEQHIQEIQKKRKDLIADVAVKYKKYRADTWKTFMKNKNLCVKS